MNSQEPNSILGFSEVHQMTGLSRSTLWRYERLGQFPRRRQITKGRVGWTKREVLAWIESLPQVGGGQHDRD